ncbi:MAG: PfkB family carbohydrate kinase [Candidatus Hodarchaeales archaeon]|jgi:hypothetical protein
MRKKVITVALGQMVLDIVIHNHQNPHSIKNSLTLGGPPSFVGLLGLILSKVFPWMSPPSVYAYACPKAISLLKRIPEYDLISKNLKIQSKCPQFRLVYSSDEKERNLYLKNPPLQFNPTNFKWEFKNPPVAIIGSVYHEFNNHNIFTFLRDKCSFIAFDAQGCFRQLTPDGKITFRNWWDPRIIENVDCLKISEMEAKLLNFGSNPLEIVSKILETSVTSVLLTRGRNGAILGFKKQKYGDIRVYNIPAFIEGTVVDETGAGDVFLFLFVTHFHTFTNELEAISFATSVTSLVLEQNRFMGKFTEETVHLRQEKVRHQIIEFLR